MRKRCMNVLDDLVLALRRITRPARARRGIAARTMFSRTERSGMMPSALRSRAAWPDPRLDGGGCARRRIRLPATETEP